MSVCLPAAFILTYYIVYRDTVDLIQGSLGKDLFPFLLIIGSGSNFGVCEHDSAAAVATALMMMIFCIIIAIINNYCIINNYQ